MVVYEKGDHVPPPEEESIALARIQPGDPDYWATVEFVRVAYDVMKAVAKIQAIADLDDFLGAPAARRAIRSCVAII